MASPFVLYTNHSWVKDLENITKIIRFLSLSSKTYEPHKFFASIEKLQHLDIMLYDFFWSTHDWLSKFGLALDNSSSAQQHTGGVNVRL